MSFFDKQEEVIDIKLTQFGKNLLSRGAFKPAYYQFFDDGTTYNSECNYVTEKQNKSEERIFAAPTLKTIHCVSSVEKAFDLYESQIVSGEAARFAEISRRQDPLISEKLLKYPLKDSFSSRQKAPFLKMLSIAKEPISMTSELSTNIATYRIPQINFDSSYRIIKDTSKAIPEEDMLDHLKDNRKFFDLTSKKITFLDGSFLEVEDQEIIIDLEEKNTQNVFDNFEIEIFEILEEQGANNDEILIRLETEEQVLSLFEISIDDQVMTTRVVDERFPHTLGDR